MPSLANAMDPHPFLAGAQLMNNLAELAIRDEPTATKRKQAEAWARQGLATIEKTKASARGDEEGLMLCEEALAAVLFNLGSLLEVQDGAPIEILAYSSTMTIDGW